MFEDFDNEMGHFSPLLQYSGTPQYADPARGNRDFIIDQQELRFPDNGFSSPEEFTDHILNAVPKLKFKLPVLHLFINLQDEDFPTVQQYATHLRLEITRRFAKPQDPRRGPRIITAHAYDVPHNQVIVVISNKNVANKNSKAL